MNEGIKVYDQLAYPFLEPQECALLLASDGGPVHKKTITWTAGGKKREISAGWFLDHDEANRESWKLAHAAGWTAPRWWQWWRWDDTKAPTRIMRAGDATKGEQE